MSFPTANINPSSVNCHFLFMQHQHSKAEKLQLSVLSSLVKEKGGFDAAFIQIAERKERRGGTELT